MSEPRVGSLITIVAESYGRSPDEWLDCFADPLVVATPESTLALEREGALCPFDPVLARFVADVRCTAKQHNECCADAGSANYRHDRSPG